MPALPPWPSQRAVTLACACVVGLSGGTNYVYSAYAPQLAAQLSLSSTQANIIGAAGNAGVYLSAPFIGRAVDRKGPTRMLAFAAVAIFTGYYAIRLIYVGGEEGLFASVGVTGLALAEMLTGIGSTAGLSAAGNSVAKSYRKNRATALSLVLSAFGLSAFFYSNVWRALFRSAEDPTSALLLLLALGAGGSMTLGAISIRPSPHSSLAEAPSEEEEEPSAVGEGEPLLSEVIEEPTERTPLNAKAPTYIPINVSGWGLLKELDFWLLFTFNGLCSGTGLMYINNLGNLAKTLAPPGTPSSQIAMSQGNLVSLLSVFNFLGRLVTGSLSDYALHRAPIRFRFSRVWWNVSTASLFVISQVLANFATTIQGWHGLVLPTIVTGFAHGSLFGISGILALERFGMKHFSSNNGILALAPALFGQSSNYMFGRIYDHHVPALSSDNSSLAEHVCSLGRECFAEAFHVTTGAALLAVAVGVTLTMRKSMKRRAA